VFGDTIRILYAGELYAAVAEFFERAEFKNEIGERLAEIDGLSG